MQLKVAFVVVAAALVAGGCVQTAGPAPVNAVPASDKYQGPAASAPHATVEVRTVYAKKPAPSLSEQVTVDGRKAASTRLPATSGTSRTVAVAPGKNVFKMRSEFGTPTTKIQKKKVTAYVSQVHPCGGFKGGMCRELVPVERVIDRPVTTYNQAAGCEASAAPTVAAGDKVLLEYDFHDANVCELKCFKQLPGGKTVPCDDEDKAAAAKLPLPAPATVEGGASDAAKPETAKSPAAAPHGVR